MRTRAASYLTAAVFLALGILGIADTSLVGKSPGATFDADTLHNIVHMLTAALFIMGGLFFPNRVAMIMMVYGIMYFFPGVLGFANDGAKGFEALVELLHDRAADNFLHIGIGFALFLVGLSLRKPTESATIATGYSHS